MAREGGLWVGIQDAIPAFWLTKGRSNLHVSLQAKVETAPGITGQPSRARIIPLLQSPLSQNTS
jgi:hypothetical protein